MAVEVSLKEFTNDPEEKIKQGGIKYDGGKAPIFRGGLGYFPRAISAVSAVSAFGASKYAWNGWQQVDDGYNRYSDALVRHLTYEAEGETLDPDSGLPHAAHAAWNSLARLELLLRKSDENNEQIFDGAALKGLKAYDLPAGDSGQADRTDRVAIPDEDGRVPTPWGHQQV